MKLRGALLGAGNIALKSHAPQWTQDERLRGEVEIVAVADLSPSNLESARLLLPDARFYPNAESLLERESLDFCDICTPPFNHRSLIETAAGRGLHLVCEKPLAPSVGDARQIARAVRDARVVFQPCHQYHHSPQWQAVRRLVPRLGRLYLAEYSVQRTAANEGNPNWSPGWRIERKLAGGGILVDHGAHIFYQLHAVLGAPRTVRATTAKLLHRHYDVEDTALVTLDFGDALAHVTLTWAARRREIRYRFVGERGEITGDDRHVTLHADRTEEQFFDEGMSRNSSHAEWYAPLLREFCARVRDGDRTTRALDEAMYVTRLLASIYESAERGMVVPVVGAEPIPQTAAADVAVETGTAVGSETRGAARKWAVRGAAFVAQVLCLIWISRGIAWSDLGRAIAMANPWWIGLAAALNLGFLSLRAAAWRAVLRPLGGRAKYSDAFKALSVGSAVSALLPARAGELARMQWLRRKSGLSAVTVLSSMALEQLTNASGLLLLLAVLPFMKNVPPWMGPAAAVAVTLFAVGTIVVIALKPRRGGEGSEESAARRGLARILANARRGLAAVHDPKSIGRSLAASLAGWAVEIGVTMLSLRAVGLHLPLSAGILVLLAANLALLFPLAPPGNVGTLEVGATIGLMAFGVPKTQALAFALCYHALQLVPITILGALIAGREAWVAPFGHSPRRSAATP
jgi:hypothetical protein